MEYEAMEERLAAARRRAASRSPEETEAIVQQRRAQRERRNAESAAGMFRSLELLAAGFGHQLEADNLGDAVAEMDAVLDRAARQAR